MSLISSRNFTRPTFLDSTYNVDLLSRTSEQEQFSKEVSFWIGCTESSYKDRYGEMRFSIDEYKKFGDEFKENSKATFSKNGCTLTLTNLDGKSRYPKKADYIEAIMSNAPSGTFEVEYSTKVEFSGEDFSLMFIDRFFCTFITNN